MRGHYVGQEEVTRTHAQTHTHAHSLPDGGAHGGGLEGGRGDGQRLSAAGVGEELDLHGVGFGGEMMREGEMCSFFASPQKGSPLLFTRV